MLRFALTTALTLSLAAPAFASSQLANGLGIDASDYTTAEIAALRSAVADDETAAANFYRKNNGASSADTTEQAIASALADDDRASARSIKASASGETLSTKSVGISAGHQQLADNLGVDANEYSLAELVHLKGVRSSDNGRGE
ncbi:hypothetical protein CLV78_104182 [Aliiruegeria haliotis]|uniref:Uncharacterized protein n=2 Tax=Aliiruegeria haliotis TaxID=1280846 RepID=A0A2T0RRB3_9RHOB|nr:hypothetical protein CLV78_104182 [Aliiruegeria haliotis]